MIVIAGWGPVIIRPGVPVAMVIAIIRLMMVIIVAAVMIPAIALSIMVI
jgi:hypothetical protein